MGKYNPFIWGTVAPLAQSFGQGVQHEVSAQQHLHDLMTQYQALRPMEIQNEIEKRKALAGYETERPLTPEEQSQGTILSQLLKQDYPDMPLGPADLARLGKGESPLLRYLGQRQTTQERALYHKMLGGQGERKVAEAEKTGAARRVLMDRQGNLYDERGEYLSGPMADWKEAQTEALPMDVSSRATGAAARMKAAESGAALVAPKTTLMGAQTTEHGARATTLIPAQAAQAQAQAGLAQARTTDVPQAAIDRRTRANRPPGTAKPKDEVTLQNQTALALKRSMGLGMFDPVPPDFADLHNTAMIHARSGIPYKLVKTPKMVQPGLIGSMLGHKATPSATEFQWSVQPDPAAGKPAGPAGFSPQEQDLYNWGK